MFVLEKLKPYLFFALLFIICLAYSSTAMGYDYDLWARLIVGKAVIQTGGVLMQDFLSYTPTHAWIDHEWGASVVFYLVQLVFGATGILVFQAILTFLIFFFVYKVVEIHIPEYVPKYDIAFYFMGIFVIQEVFNYPIRCHMFSFLFFAIFLYILELARIKNINKPLILLPFLIIIWNNLHGGVVSGIGLLVLYAAGEFLNLNSIKKYICVLLVIFPLLLINPYGMDYLNFLFHANTMARVDITEWWGLFHPALKNMYWGFKIFAGIVLLIEFIKCIKYGFSYYKMDKTKFILLATTLYLAVDHIKLMRFFIIVGLIFAYIDFYELVKNLKFPKWKNIVVYSLILICTWSLFNIGSFKPKVSFVFPVLETEFLKINNLKGKLLVNLGLGSYVSYKLYPNNLIYMDGRYEEVYYDEMIPLLKKFHLVARGWAEILFLYPPDVMILEKGYPIIDIMKQVKGWHMAYDGVRFTVFVSDKIKKDNYVMPTMNLYHYEKSIFDTDVDFTKDNKNVK